MIIKTILFSLLCGATVPLLAMDGGPSSSSLNSSSKAPILLETKAHDGSVTALAWRPDGKYVVSASNDNMLRYWNDQGAVHCLGAIRFEVSTMTFSPSGRLLLLGGSHGDGMAVETKTDHRLNFMVCNEGGAVRSIQIDETATGAVLLTDACKHLHNMELFEPKRIMQSISKTELSITCFPTVCRLDEVKIIPILKNKNIVSHSTYFKNAYYSFKDPYLSDKPIVVTALNKKGDTCAIVLGNTKIELFHLTASDPVWFKGYWFAHTAPITALTFSPCGKLLVLADQSGRWCIIDWQNNCWYAFQHPAPIRSLAIKPDGKVLAVGDEKGDLTLYDVTHLTTM